MLILSYNVEFLNIKSCNGKKYSMIFGKYSNFKLCEKAEKMLPTVIKLATNAE